MFLNMSDFNPTFAEDSVSDSESAEEPPEKKAKKLYTQQFRHQWLEDPVFKGWLVCLRPGENSCTCKVCNKSVSCSKTALRRHSESAEHKRAIRSATVTGQRQGNLVECLQCQEESRTYRDTTEARVCSFLAQHNLTFSLKTSLMSLFKLSQLHLKMRTKFSYSTESICQPAGALIL